MIAVFEREFQKADNVGPEFPKHIKSSNSGDTIDGRTDNVWLARRQLPKTNT